MRDDRRPQQRRQIAPRRLPAADSVATLADVVEPDDRRRPARRRAAARRAAADRRSRRCHLRKMRSSVPSRIAPRRIVVDASRSGALPRATARRRSGRSRRVRLDREAGIAPVPPLGEHVVEQHGVDAAEHQIAVRMHVVFVRDRLRCRARARRAAGSRRRSCRRACATRRPRRSASVRKRAASASRTLRTSRNS